MAFAEVAEVRVDYGERLQCTRWRSGDSGTGGAACSKSSVLCLPPRTASTPSPAPSDDTCVEVGIKLTWKCDRRARRRETSVSTPDLRWRRTWRTGCRRRWPPLDITAPMTIASEPLPRPTADWTCWNKTKNADTKLLNLINSLRAKLAPWGADSAINSNNRKSALIAMRRLLDYSKFVYLRKLRLLTWHLAVSERLLSSPFERVVWPSLVIVYKKKMPPACARMKRKTSKVPPSFRVLYYFFKK